MRFRAVRGRIRDEGRYAWGVHALGAAGVGLAVAHAVTESEGLESVFEALLVLAVALTLFRSGRTMSRSSLSRAGRRQTFLIALATGVVFASLPASMYIIWSLDGTRFPEPVYVGTMAWVLGSAVGAHAGYYTARSAEERARVEELNKLLRVNQRLLRHNLRNELGVIRGYADEWRDRTTDEDALEALDTVDAHVGRLLDISDRARLVVAIWDADARVEWDLADVVRERASVARERYPDADVSVDASGPCRVTAHPRLPLAIDEVLDNAVRHNSDGVSVSVRVTQSDEECSVRVADTGVGIDRADVAALFRPEETPLEHLSGLGLWVVYWTVERSGGRLDFEPNDPRGTRVSMTFPRTREHLRPSLFDRVRPDAATRDPGSAP